MLNANYTKATKVAKCQFYNNNISRCYTIGLVGLPSYAAMQEYAVHACKYLVSNFILILILLAAFSQSYFFLGLLAVKKRLAASQPF